MQQRARAKLAEVEERISDLTTIRDTLLAALLDLDTDSLVSTRDPLVEDIWDYDFDQGLARPYVRACQQLYPHRHNQDLTKR